MLDTTWHNRSQAQQKLTSYYEQNKQQFLRFSLQILTEYNCVWKYIVCPKYKVM